MTLKTSFSIGLAAAMLVLGVQTASARLTPDADQQKRTDFWNYDARTGEKTANTSPRLGPQDLAALVSTSGSDSSTAIRTPDVFERAVAAHVAAQSNVSRYPDVVDRAVAAKLAHESSIIVSPDAVDRALASRLDQAPRPIVSPDAVDRAVRARADYGGNRRFDDRFNTGSNEPAPVSATTSGDGIEWPQIGVAFGLGIMLSLGLGLALRMTRGRRLVHG
jgi:hypothetical protein